MFDFEALELYKGFNADRSEQKSIEITYGGDRPTDDEQAFQISVRKWAFIIALLKHHPDKRISGLGSLTCGFCMRYAYYNIRMKVDDICNGCPIKEKSGDHSCKKTPFEDASRVIAHGVPFQNGELFPLEQRLGNARRELAYILDLGVERGWLTHDEYQKISAFCN